jgi:hypothetical protein
LGISGGDLSKELKKKVEMILAREKRMARSIALKAIQPKPFSVWEVMIPVIFIMGYMRAKADREVFTQNMLFTKKMALEATRDMIRENHTKAAVLMRIELQTKELLATAPAGIYSDAIRQEQLREIDLLIEHYCKLIQAEGNDFASLVLSAYRSREDYTAFQQKLTAAERKVTRAARQTLKARTDSKMVARIEAATNQLRLKEVESIFSSDARR